MNFTKLVKSEPQNGIVFNSYDIESQQFPYGELIITNHNNTKKYAVDIEFNF